MVATSVMTILFLSLPLWDELFSYFGVLAIPLATILLAFLYPIRWYASAVAVTILQSAMYGGYALRGGTFVRSDIPYCVTFLGINAVVVGLIAEFRCRKRTRVLAAADRDAESPELPS